MGKRRTEILITEIYDDPLPKTDKRQEGNNNIYTKFIETVLLQYLARQVLISHT